MKETEDQAHEVATVVTVPVKFVIRLSTQPRTWFDKDKLQALGNSIKAEGQAQPALVVELPHKKGEPQQYQLVDGERRWRAIKFVGLKWIDVIVKDVRDLDHHHKLSLISNFNREDHTHSEKVRGILDLRISGMKAEEIAIAVGKSTAWVNQYSTLAKLHPEILKFLDPPTPESDRLSFQVAVRIATVKTASAQMELFQKVQDEQRKGTSYKVIEQTLRRVMDQGNYARHTQSGRAPRKKRTSDYLKSFESLSDLSLTTIMKLEDFDTNIVLAFIRKHGPDNSKSLAGSFRTFACLLNKFADDIEKNAHATFHG